MQWFFASFYAAWWHIKKAKKYKVFPMIKKHLPSLTHEIMDTIMKSKPIWSIGEMLTCMSNYIHKSSVCMLNVVKYINNTLTLPLIN